MALLQPVPANDDKNLDQGSVGTRARILEAAARLFATKGYTASSTREIAAAVGIQQPGLYKHFASKEAILVALCDRVVGYPTSVAQQLADLRPSPEVALYRYLYETCMHMCREPYLLAALLRTAELRLGEFPAWQEANRSAISHITNLVAEGIDSGAVREIRRESASRLLLGLVEMLVTPNEPVPSEDDVVAIMDFAFNSLLRDRRRLPALIDEAMRLPLSVADLQAELAHRQP